MRTAKPELMAFYKPIRVRYPKKSRARGATRASTPTSLFLADTYTVWQEALQEGQEYGESIEPVGSNDHGTAAPFRAHQRNRLPMAEEACCIRAGGDAGI